MSAPFELEQVLADLEAAPRELRAAAERLGEAASRVPPAGGGFCLVEQAWHLGDLEREGYGLRIRRLLSEENPLLPDFDGGRIAAERDYRTKSLQQGIAAFAAARRDNLALLRSLAPEQWQRTGSQEGVGSVVLRDVPRMMLDHDASHRAEIAALLAGAVLPRESARA